MSSGPEYTEAQQLIDALLDSQLDDAGQKRLEKLLSEDAEARAYYLAMMGVQAELYWQHGASALPEPTPEELLLKQMTSLAELGGEAKTNPTTPEPQTPQTPATFWALLSQLPTAIQPVQHPIRFFSVAALVTTIFWGVVVLIWFPSWHESTNSGQTSFVQFRKYPAYILHLENVRWAKEQHPIAAGSYLASEEIVQFEQGQVSLLFGSGARVVVEGPARLWAVDRGRMMLERGRLLSRVEGDARGFAVETPVVQVIDLGTEFGVEVRETETEVQVFQGRVSIMRAGQTHDVNQLLAAGEAAVFGMSPQSGLEMKEKEMNRAIYIGLATLLAMPVGPMLDTAQEAHAILLPSGAPDPNFGGLKVWYNAGSVGVGEGNQVSTWASSAATVNSATQGNTARRPTWTANGLNGLPTLVFDGTDDQFIMGTNVFQNGNLPNTYFAVFRSSDSSAHIIGLGSSQSGFLDTYGSGLIINGTAGVKARNNTSGFLLNSTTTNFSSGVFLTATAGGGNNTIRVMGLTEGSSTTAADTFAYPQATIGASDGSLPPTTGAGSAIDPFAGEISEILVYGALTSQQIADVENYLYVKYFTQAPAEAPIPEPTSGALLGLGGLVVLSQRRRLPRACGKK